MTLPLAQFVQRTEREAGRRRALPGAVEVAAVRLGRPREFAPAFRRILGLISVLGVDRRPVRSS